jgi:glycosyltransferase involved in cell wall biosynthesis
MLKYYIKRATDKCLGYFSAHRYLTAGKFMASLAYKADRDEHDTYVDQQFKTALLNRDSLPNVTAVYRIKNAEEFVSLSIQSVIPLASEIVVVDNGSVDNTKTLVMKLQKQYSEIVTIKYYKYDQAIARAGLGYAAEVAGDPKKSIADFYNFCFSKATSDYIIKVDAHCLYSLNRILDVQSYLRKDFDILYFRGVEYLGKRLSIEPYLFKRSLDFTYEDEESYEILKFKNKQLKKATLLAPVFIHIKRILYTKGLISSQAGLEAIYSDK